MTLRALGAWPRANVVFPKKKPEGLAVASIARDDPSPLPGMHRDHNALPSQRDGQTDTDIVA